MTNDQAINFIHDYCSKTIPKPKVGWPHYYLQEVAQSSCAASEIIKRLESSTDDPVQTVKQFKEGVTYNDLFQQNIKNIEKSFNIKY